MVPYGILITATFQCNLSLAYEISELLVLYTPSLKKNESHRGAFQWNLSDISLATSNANELGEISDNISKTGRDLNFVYSS
jgi:hypothetical protein